MGKHSNAWLLTITVCTLLISCKLDPAPPNIGSIKKEDDTVLGMTIVGPELYNPYLTAQWKVTYTVLEYYDTTTVVIGGGINPNFFSGVVLNDDQRKFNFINLTSNINATGNYKLNTTANVFYLTLPADPFSRSANTPIRITKLNSQTMAWVAMDSTLTTYNHKPVRKAYKVLFYK